MDFSDEIYNHCNIYYDNCGINNIYRLKSEVIEIDMDRCIFSLISDWGHVQVMYF